MWAPAGSFNEVPLPEQVSHLRFIEVIPGLHGSPAGHHVKCFLQGRFLVRWKGAGSSLRKKFTHELDRVDASFKQKNGECMNADRMKPDGFRFDAEFQKQWTYPLESFQLQGVDIDDDR